MAISSSAPSRLPDHRLIPVCALARGPRELAAHFAIRRSVFVEAQALFEDDDRDDRDDDPATLHAVGLTGDEIVGAVRLYRLDHDGLWKGDRLAVLPTDRALRLGAMLVRFAVRIAGEHGGRLMVAQVQVPNIRFFERLGWRRDGDTAPMLGVEHQPMAIELSPDPAEIVDGSASGVESAWIGRESSGRGPSESGRSALAKAPGGETPRDSVRSGLSRRPGR